MFTELLLPLWSPLLLRLRRGDGLRGGRRSNGLHLRRQFREGLVAPSGTARVPVVDIEILIRKGIDDADGGRGGDGLVCAPVVSSMASSTSSIIIRLRNSVARVP